MCSCFDDRMLWRERDWPDHRAALAADGHARQRLACWGLLKFMENDLPRSQDRLLRYLVRCWNKQRKVMVLWGCDLAICPETDIYLVTELLPKGQVLRYPLPSGRVDLERFLASRYGGAPLMEGCIAIATVTNLAEKCALAAIVLLVGLSAPHRASGPQVSVLRQLRVSHFFDFAHFYYDGMLAHISKV